MANLVYAAIASLDGYIADKDGNFDWAMPDDEVHAFINDLERRCGTYLYGRRMYETMVGWETMDVPPEQPITRDFADVWRSADKIVYSKTLDTVSSARTRIEREFDPEAVRHLKDEAARDLAIAGPSLATHAFRAGLVDEVHLFVTPIIVGGGTPGLPNGVLLKLDLREERRFGNGMVYLSYTADR